MYEIRSDDLQGGKLEFKQHVDSLCVYAKEQRKQGSPLPHLRRKRLTSILVERYMRFALQFGECGVDGEHIGWAYQPPAYELTRLSDVLLQE